jgi:hypothetical protein
MVLPRGVREEIVTVPGDVLLRRTADGLLLTAAQAPATLTDGDDGLPVLSVGRPVSNAEILHAIEQGRSDRRWDA